MAKPKDPDKIPLIFQACLQEVRKSGYAGLKMSAVAAAAGIATGTLYIYFPSKEELVNHLFLAIKREVMEVLSRAFIAEADFYSQFKSLYFSYWNLCLLQPEKQLFIQQFHQSEYLYQTTHEEAEALLDPLHHLLQSGIQSGLVKDHPTALLLAQIEGPILEIIKRSHTLPAENNQALCANFFQMAWCAIRT